MSSCETLQTEAGQVVYCAASSSGWWWASPVVIIISAIVAGIFSYLSIRSSREMARKRATLDFIERSESTEYYQKLYQSFAEVRKDDGGLVQLCSPTNPQLKRQRQRVIDYLNHYEMMAMGIRGGMLDEGVYKGFMRGTVVRDWFAAKEFIDHLRRPTPDSGSEVSTRKVFCEFEALAKRWTPEIQMELPIEERPKRKAK